MRSGDPNESVSGGIDLACRRYWRKVGELGVLGTRVVAGFVVWAEVCLDFVGDVEEKGVFEEDWWCSSGAKRMVAEDVVLMCWPLSGLEGTMRLVVSGSAGDECIDSLSEPPFKRPIRGPKGVTGPSSDDMIAEPRRDPNGFRDLVGAGREGVRYCRFSLSDSAEGRARSSNDRSCVAASSSSLVASSSSPSSSV